MKILFVSRWFPYPFDNGSKIRVYNLVRALSRSHDIDLISFFTDSISDEHLKVMRQYCQHITTIAYRVGRQDLITTKLGFLSKKPRSVVATYSKEMQSLIHKAASCNQYDLLISSQVDMVAYTHHWKSSPMILEELELTSLYEDQLRAKNRLLQSRSKLMWLKWKQYIKSTIESYQCCTVVSEMERLRVKDVAPQYTSIQVVPNGVDTTYLSGDYGEVEPESLVYSGALSYFPNLDAVTYFINEIFPLIKRHRPNAKLYITGSTKGINLNGMADFEGVVFTGYLPDIRPRIAQSAVNIVPLRYGGGTRLKILESLALRTPVVSTRKGLEGLDLIPGEDLIQADSPEQFAEEVTRILEDRSLRDRLGQKGCESVKRQYDWERIGERLDKIIKNMV